MNKIDHLQFKSKFSLEVLPTETLFGIKTVNCEVLCEDDKYRPMGGVELGFIFFTITFVKLFV
jgi:hypothetical protein|tara:strand:+ start:29 stop:217 length:189 start_codon:yes stop_codon:yes gene_type:complete